MDTYDYPSMSLDELKQLKELVEQSLTYYSDILSKDELKEGDIQAVQMCYDMMKNDMNDIIKEIELR